MFNFKATIFKSTLFFLLIIFPAAQGLSEEYEKKVFIHVMGWYGDSLATGEDSLRHWKLGHAHNPRIGRYNSHHPSLNTYHALLTNACGIDGIIINCKDDYDFKTAQILTSRINYIKELVPDSFKLNFAISYDDQAANDTNALKTKLIFIRDSILSLSSQYLKLDSLPILFIYNYPGYLNANEYRRISDAFFEPNPLLIWNESDSSVFRYVDACYSWVEPTDGIWDTMNGLEWGSGYIDGHFWRVDNWPQLVPGSILKFALSGVWPGFDDRFCSWTENRFMVRQDGAVYDSTWLKIINYQKVFPVPWVYVITLNDWNEGSEVEPSHEHGFKYLKATINNINIFKNINLSDDDIIFTAAESIYVANRLIELGLRDSALLDSTIKSYVKREYSKALVLAQQIIHDTTSGIIDNNQIENKSSLYNIENIKYYPNGEIKLQLKLNKPANVQIQLFDLLGRLYLKKSLKLVVGTHKILLNDLAKKNRSGLLLLHFKIDNEKIVKTFIISQ